jgi:gas vesicle protein
MGRESYDNGSRNDNRGIWIFGLVLGVLGGTAVALLTAPKTGREMRGAIKDTAQNMPGKVNELVDESLDVYASALN